MSPSRILLVGPPNAGKSTLFNRLTGASAGTGNYAGTTVSVERSSLRLGDAELPVLDLPGTMSLVAHAADEEVTLRALLDGAKDGAIVLLVLDGPRLSRSLYLALQVVELGLPTVIAVNLMDEARESGRPPDIAALGALFGTVAVGVSARSGEGVEALREALGRAVAAPASVVPSVSVSLPPATEADAAALVGELPAWARSADHPGRERALALWALQSADGAHAAGRELPTARIEALHAAAVAGGRDLDGEIIGGRYAFVDAHAPGLVAGVQLDDRVRRRTDAIDRVLLHPVLGSVVFLLTMGAMFLALFSWSDPLIGLVEAGFGWLAGTVTDAFASSVAAAGGDGSTVALLRDLLVDGVIAGVGSVLVFVPQIAVLFVLLSIMEDCGYLARAAALVDRILRAAGLPGRAFVPLLSGYACAVPAVMATRSIPRFRDRLLTMLVVPLTSCSARLPVYTLVVGALFPLTLPGSSVPVRPLALLGMYVFSTVVTLGSAVVLGRLVVPGDAIATVLELPPYRVPDPRNVMRAVRMRVSDFVREAGRVILVATIVLWGLLSFPRYTPEELLGAEAATMDEATRDESVAKLSLERSYAGRLGHAIEPVIAPLGFDWKTGIGLIGAFAAREVFVATMGMVYGMEEADEESVGLRDKMRAEVRADGTPRWTIRTGASVMVFFALAMQCLSTLAVLRKETDGWRWPLFITAYMTALAWSASWLTFHGLGWLGVP